MWSYCRRLHQTDRVQCTSLLFWVFFAHPASKYTPLEKTLEKILPSSTQSTKNILPRPLFPPPPRHWLFRGPLSTSADGWPSHLFPHRTQHQFIICVMFSFSPRCSYQALCVIEGPTPVLMRLCAIPADITRPVLPSIQETEQTSSSPVLSDLWRPNAELHLGLSGWETCWTDGFPEHFFEVGEGNIQRTTLFCGLALLGLVFLLGFWFILWTVFDFRQT